MKQLIIVGAGEFGRELYWNIQESIGYGEKFTLKGYLDDGEEKDNKLQLPIIGTTIDYRIEEDDVFTCAIANPQVRENVIKRLLDREAEFIDIIHKTAIIHGSVKYGKGLILSPYSLLGDSSILGNYVVVNGFSAIGHDCEIGDYTCIMSHCDITGHTKMGQRVYIGGGVGTVPKARIGSDAYVGAGSVVLRKVNPGVKVFGNPAVEI